MREEKSATRAPKLKSQASIRRCLIMSLVNLFCEKAFLLSSLSMIPFHFLRVDLLFGGLTGLMKKETRKSNLLIVSFHMLTRIKSYFYHKRKMRMNNHNNKVPD